MHEFDSYGWLLNCIVKNFHFLPSSPPLPLSLSPSLPLSLSRCCSVFENNTSLEDNKDTSAIAAFRFPTVFSGYNNFTGNVGGGITLLNTRMEVNGSLWFQANRAVFGAGLAMDDRCLVSVHFNVYLIA